MTYATPAAILARVDADDLARAATPDTAVDGALLSAVIERPGQSTYSGYTTAAIASARRAVATIEAAIADASGDIDGYLANRYQLPLSNVPTKLQSLCNDLVIWRLLGGATQGDEKSERYQRVQDALRWLERLASGALSLAAQLDNAPSNNPGTVVVAGAAPVFDRDHLAAY